MMGADRTKHTSPEENTERRIPNSFSSTCELVKLNWQLRLFLISRLFSTTGSKEGRKEGRKARCVEFNASILENAQETRISSAPLDENTILIRSKKLKQTLKQ
ncbi:hypothetical protein ACS0PU_000184 [Formica fusca]